MIRCYRCWFLSEDDVFKNIKCECGEDFYLCNYCYEEMDKILPVVYCIGCERNEKLKSILG